MIVENHALISTPDAILAGMLLGILITLWLYHFSLSLRLRQTSIILFTLFMPLSAYSLFAENSIWDLVFGLSLSHFNDEVVMRLSALLALAILSQLGRYYFKSFAVISLHSQVYKYNLFFILFALIINLFVLKASSLTFFSNALFDLAVMMTFILLWHTAVKAVKNNLPGSIGFVLHQILLSMLLIAYWWDHTVFKSFSSDSALHSIWPAVLFSASILAIAWGFGYQLKALREEKERTYQLMMRQSHMADIGQVFVSITHQAKLPLSRIGNLLMLFEVWLTQSEADYENKIKASMPKLKEQIDYLETTIEEFSQFHQPVEVVGKLDLPHLSTSLTSLLANKTMLSDTFIRIDDQTKGQAVYTDVNALSHVLMIVLDNALDILWERGVNQTEINLKVEVESGFVKISVCDFAGGIKLLPIDQVFEHFVSLKKKGGTGMGLSIAKLLTEERLKGSINAYNTGVGACFVVCFPNKLQKIA